MHTRFHSDPKGSKDPIILDALLVFETPYDLLIIGPDVSDEVVAEDVEGRSSPARSARRGR
jgi:hypothetical protein